MKKLSIIIPVYNVEKYVAKCINSCLNQNLSKEEYEIIIINDGATDKSLEIVNNINKNQDNVSVFSQKNGGLSLARNKGLELAQGEYVWFIDSDDWIEVNCLNGILVKLNEIDVLAIGYIEAYDDTTKNNEVRPAIISGNTGIDLIKKSYIVPAQFYIYNRKFLKENNLFFELGIFHEDFEFTPRMLYLAKKLEVYDKQIYFFYKRLGSITTSVNPKKSFDLVKIALNLVSFENSIVKKADKYIFHNMIWLAINNALHNSLIMDKKTKYELRMEFYNNRWMFKYLKSSTIFKYRIERILFLIFPKQTTIIYQLLKTNSK
jgi:glycosyltransferase involved in cell wall biosynthesis